MCITISTYSEAEGSKKASPPPKRFSCGASIPFDDPNDILSKLVIATRCTDPLLWTFSLFLGLIVGALQSVPLLTNGWVYVTEPKPFNKTNENGDLMDTVFLYNSGYFEMCRQHASINADDGTVAEDIRPYLSTRLGIPTSMHIIGAAICFTAFCCGIIGHLKRNSRTLLAAILYIFGGLVVLVGVLQFVCVVDDELAPRMKPNAAGEPSKFSFVYGYSFFFTSLSFLPLQMCACCHAFLYFRRFPTALDKMKIVPGLEAQLKRVQVIMALESVSPPEAMQRGSFCAFVYQNQPGSRRCSRYNMSSPVLIPQAVTQCEATSKRADALSSIYAVTDVL